MWKIFNVLLETEKGFATLLVAAEDEQMIRESKVYRTENEALFVLSQEQPKVRIEELENCWYKWHGNKAPKVLQKTFTITEI